MSQAIILLPQLLCFHLLGLELRVQMVLRLHFQIQLILQLGHLGLDDLHLFYLY